ATAPPPRGFRGRLIPAPGSPVGCCTYNPTPEALPPLRAERASPSPPPVPPGAAAFLAGTALPPAHVERLAAIVAAVAGAREDGRIDAGEGLGLVGAAAAA